MAWYQRIYFNIYFNFIKNINFLLLFFICIFLYVYIINISLVECSPNKNKKSFLNCYLYNGVNVYSHGPLLPHEIKNYFLKLSQLKLEITLNLNDFKLCRLINIKNSHYSHFNPLYHPQVYYDIFNNINFQFYVIHPMSTSRHNDNLFLLNNVSVHYPKRPQWVLNNLMFVNKDWADLVNNTDTKEIQFINDNKKQFNEFKNSILNHYNISKK